MYEQNEPMIFRRILWIVLGCVLIVALLWVIVWFIFFRHHDDTSSKLPTPSASQGQQVPSSQGKSTNQKSSGSSKTENGSTATPNAPSASTSATGTSTPATTSPTTNSSSSELANTGAGDVITPFIVAVTVGTGGYYLYQRRKAISE